MRWRRILLFFGVTLVVTHSINVAFVVSGGSWSSTEWVWLAQVMMLVPGLTALVLQRWVYREPLRESLAIRFRPNRWFLVAWLAPPLLAFATLGLSLALPWVDWAPEMGGVLDRHMLSEEQLAGGMEVSGSTGLHPLVLFALTGLVLGPTFSLVGGLGEEIGWRGFLYRESERLGFWPSCLFIGVVWGLWHVPQVLLGHLEHGSRLVGAALFVVMVILYTPLFNYIRLRSGSSVAAALFHASGNASAMIAVAPTRGADPLWTGIGSLPFCALLLVIDVVIFFADPSLRRKEPL